MTFFALSHLASRSLPVAATVTTILVKRAASPRGGRFLEAVGMDGEATSVCHRLRRARLYAWEKGGRKEGRERVRIKLFQHERAEKEGGFKGGEGK